MRVLRLIDNFSLKNAGVWKVATATCGKWEDTEIFFYSQGPLPKELYYLQKFYCKNWINETWDIIESHGVWQWNTSAAYKYSKKRNIPWIAVPHGMLEPWSMKQKALKKQLYFNLVEKPYLKKASAIKAVSLPEAENLKKQFGSLVHQCYNPVNLPPKQIFKKAEKPIQFVFLGRLHHKKNPLMLLDAWQLSGLKDDTNSELLFVGPDDGEKASLEQNIEKYKLYNVHIKGALYGEAKNEVLSNAHVFVLPSQSEGLPSTAVEAMAYNMQCILSEECNFPEAFDFDSVVKTKLSIAALSNSLLFVSSEKPSQKTLTKSRDFAFQNFAFDSVVLQELSLYRNAINN